ncbi:hypothetical protein VTK73DRAFT_1577 [Phialemonium thermophilum]|uniref:Uncharacterized protein n=1 Tax=Phialemonium thermophilum TaxID=223376 RepID=A0ABR3VT90_9PEZI
MLQGFHRICARGSVQKVTGELDSRGKRWCVGCGQGKGGRKGVVNPAHWLQTRRHEWRVTVGPEAVEEKKKLTREFEVSEKTPIFSVRLLTCRYTSLSGLVLGVITLFLLPACDHGGGVYLIRNAMGKRKRLSWGSGKGSKGKSHRGCTQNSDLDNPLANGRRTWGRGP